MTTLTSPAALAHALDAGAPPHSPGEPLTDGQVGPLIDHIMRRYHDVHLEDFPRAIALARRVEAVHGGDADCPHGLADHLQMMAEDLVGHQQKEEEVLFPMMRAGRGSMLRVAIARMQVEHGDLTGQLTRLAEITRNFSVPEGACGTWRALDQLCRKLDHELREHMHLEDTVLFPHFVGAP
jgi:regulator of cell morphogenesis and NO signaling